MGWRIPLPLHLIVAVKMGRPSLSEFHFFPEKKNRNSDFIWFSHYVLLAVLGCSM